MDVTEQINKQTILAGGGSARPQYLAVNKTLNYASGSNSLLNARQERVTAIPSETNYRDSVGLFGAENIFIKIQLDIQNTKSVYTNDNTVVNEYFPAIVDLNVNDDQYLWDEAFLDFNVDLLPVDDYYPAELNNDLALVPRALVSVDLANLKTGNKYIDAWFDIRLYTKDRIEWAYDKMYVPTTDFFYIGFHARNTKRLPYNVNLKIGSELISEFDLTPDQRRYLVS